MSNGSIVSATHCAFVKQHVTGSSIRLTNVRTREIDRHQTNAAMQNGEIVNRATCFSSEWYKGPTNQERRLPASAAAAGPSRLDTHFLDPLPLAFLYLSLEASGCANLTSHIHHDTLPISLAWLVWWEATCLICWGNFCQISLLGSFEGNDHPKFPNQPQQHGWKRLPLPNLKAQKHPRVKTQWSMKGAYGFIWCEYFPDAPFIFVHWKCGMFSRFGA